MNVFFVSAVNIVTIWGNIASSKENVMSSFYVEISSEELPLILFSWSENSVMLTRESCHRVSQKSLCTYRWRWGYSEGPCTLIRRHCSYLIKLQMYLLTYSMQQIPSWEANRFAASQKNSPHFMEPEGSLLHSQVPASRLYLEPAQSIPYPDIALPEDPS
jgi:hypothetical protein